MYGICIDTHICLLLSLVARCFWQFDTKLATMWMTYFEMSVALSVQVALLYNCLKHEDILYQGKKAEFFLKWWFVAIVSLGLATIFHPGKKGEFFFTFQMFVSFTMFIEAIALVP